MKKTAFILFVAMLLASCDTKIRPEIANAFKGEYWMKTITCTMYEGHEIDEEPIWSPVSIYENQGKLYVQTDSYGAPDTDTTSTAKHEYIFEYPDHPNFVSANNYIKGSIEPVWRPGTKVVVSNGKLSTIRDGVHLRSLPIQVKSGSETVMNLEPYKPVVVSITGANGDELLKIHAWYEYGPMVKDGDVIKWEVDFKDDFTQTSGEAVEYDRILHKNTLYKR